MKTLILGGVKSGKSHLAERLAAQAGLEVVYIATATVCDEEMGARIAGHRARRPEHWRLVEESLDLARVLKREATENRCLLVDCLTLWLTNLLCAEDEVRMTVALEELPLLLPELPGHLIFVSNETGLGVVPDNRLSRRFLDLAGHLHQGMAAQCDRVVLTLAGLPYLLKGGL
ncbi:MAG: bifunctional adenosylcobinamide kinase/adenosylcobinamide-phosphate guanylyltransferase [Gammaproteobacteria bacterium]|nr:bifunctional adenosylcobinamide kinase/adenosylcobinamide-phosphate guanylyltransferase [Gammaproteobacteria bacterium]MBU1656251.1 bifunctional adenosylcobinamide kinase/adenosylcobinamide-phosphate guanylyltransferase [Gammaproteobacteria bacterium]MBU1959816.1 bifunctional adenosylcobinamide kinase/adenosylcobinamide-phosphate guanylyltransferase [Gammaproteobacteria bacterium]